MAPQCGNVCEQGLDKAYAEEGQVFSAASDPTHTARLEVVYLLYAHFKLSMQRQCAEPSIQIRQKACYDMAVLLRHCLTPSENMHHTQHIILISGRRPFLQPANRR